MYIVYIHGWDYDEPTFNQIIADAPKYDGSFGGSVAGKKLLKFYFKEEYMGRRFHKHVLRDYKRKER